MEIVPLALFFTALLLPFYKKFLIFIGGEELNYQQRLIPISFGGLILFVELLILKLFGEGSNYYSAAFLVIILFGTLDDLYGDKAIKGLKGHLKAFFAGNITTGIVKAIVGGIVAIILATILSNSIISLLISFLLILLMLNSVNLFDLRPGRAIKFFFILFTILALFTPFLYLDIRGLIILGILLIVFFQDLRAKIMIGDSGANLLGLHLGIWYSTYLPLVWQCFFIVLLIFVQIYADVKSIGKLIEDNWLLNKLDRWGRTN